MFNEADFDVTTASVEQEVSVDLGSVLLFLERCRVLGKGRPGSVQC